MATLAPWVIAAALLVHAVAGAGSHRVEVGRFTEPAEPDALPAGWEPLTFRKVPRPTRYRVVRDGAGWVLGPGARRPPRHSTARSISTSGPTRG